MYFSGVFSEISGAHHIWLDEQDGPRQQQEGNRKSGGGGGQKPYWGGVSSTYYYGGGKAQASFPPAKQSSFPPCAAAADAGQSSGGGGGQTQDDSKPTAGDDGGGQTTKEEVPVKAMPAMPQTYKPMPTKAPPACLYQTTEGQQPGPTPTQPGIKDGGGGVAGHGPTATQDDPAAPRAEGPRGRYC